MEMRLRLGRPRRRTYGVSSAGFEELVREMSGAGCWGRFTFTARHRPQGDPIERIDVTVTLGIQLPRWTRYGAADDAHKQEWDRMLEALSRHEDEHLRIFTETAESFAATVPNISTPMDRAGVTRLMREFQDEAQRAMDSFDRRTDHGQRDGVELAEP